MKFEEKYKNLNPKQREAVDTIEGPVMVIAGPGTGKTTILTLRIANILKKTDTPPDAILALTFTEAGVKAMRSKLRDIIGDRAYDVHIHTFHGFASWVISTFGDHFVHLKDREQMTDIDAEECIREILKDEKFKDLHPMGNPDFYISAIIGSISDSKKDAITPEMIKSFSEDEIERIENDELSISTRGATKGELKADAKKKIEKLNKTIIFSEVYAEYEEKKKRDEKMDYNDLLAELLFAVREDELLLRVLQEQFLYILVDEHQDTNDAQNLIITKLAEFFDNPNVFIVGDEKQAIYRFQGASVDNFLKLKNSYGDMKVIQLEDNYRSHQSILDASHSMIVNNYGTEDDEIFKKRLISGSKLKEQKIDIINSGTQNQLEEYLVESLKEILKNEEKADIAVLLMTNKDRDRVYSVINERGLSAVSEKNIDVFSHPLGILYLDLLSVIDDPSNLENLSKTIACGLWNLSFEESAVLIRSVRSGNLSEVSKKIPVLQELINSLPTSGVTDFLIRLGEGSGYVKHVLKSGEGTEIWRAIISLGEYVAKEVGRDDIHSTIKRILLYANSKKKISVKISVGKEDASIKVMTAHKSKGLEFDYVFIPYATEEYWMKKKHAKYFSLPNESKDDESEKDTRRLFYVALTRAKKHIMIFLNGEDLDGRILLPLRFLAELEEEKVNKINLPEKEIIVAPVLNREDKMHIERIEYTKRVLTEKGLSITALNHFLKCPVSFFFLSILKLPQAPNPNSEKGNAMHLALSSVWQKRPDTIEGIENIIKESINKFMDDSLLYAREKKIVRDKLIEDAPVVSRELFGHFQSKGEVYEETWSEGRFKEGEVEIPIHGKLDAIIDHGNSVLVFDYKTKKAMSENAIRGNTKSADGGYFRQLVFYKILIQGDKRFKGKDILPALVFVAPDEKGKCPIVTLPVEEKDIESLKENIKNLIENIWNGDFLKKTCDDDTCSWCKLKQAF